MKNIGYLNCDYDGFIDDSVSEKYDSYTLDDCVLVRTTDIFPFDGRVETPIHGNAYGFDSSSIIGEAILDVLREKSSYKEFKGELKKYDVCFETYRSTIHFTVNGLVSSHMYGNFEGRPYIIIEPLKYHINDKSICSLDACDTYFNDDMLLSDEAVLLIAENKFNEIKNNPEYTNDLSKFKVVVYRGDNQNKAVRDVLVGLGYDYFRINDHGYCEGLNSKKAAYKMWCYLDVLRKKYKKEVNPHFYSSFRISDIMDREKVLNKKQLEHFYYILDNSVVSEKLLKRVKKYEESGILSEIDLDMYYRNDYDIRDVMVSLVKEIGLDNIARLTKEFNDKYIEELKMRKGRKK